MFYDHIYTIVTVHSIKDCQLSKSTVTSFLRNILCHVNVAFQWGVDIESGVNLDYNKYCQINIKYDIIVILNPQSYNLICTTAL